MSFKPKKLISHSRAADAVVILPLKGETIRARLSLTTTTNTPEMPILDDSAHDKTHQQGRRPRRGWVSKFLVALNEMTALPYSFDMNQAAEVAASSPGCIVMFEEEETVDKTITAKYSATVKQNSMAHQNSSDSNTTSNSDTNSPTSTAPKAETATTSPKLTNLTLPTLPTFPDNFAVSLSLALERVLRDGDYQSVQSMTLMPQQPCHGPCGLDSVAHVGEDDENDDDYESDEVNDCEDGEDYDDEDYEEDEDEDEKRGIDNDDDEYDETSSIESSSDKSSAFDNSTSTQKPLQETNTTEATITQGKKVDNWLHDTTTLDSQPNCHIGDTQNTHNNKHSKSHPQPRSHPTPRFTKIFKQPCENEGIYLRKEKDGKYGLAAVIRPYAESCCRPTRLFAEDDGGGAHHNEHDGQNNVEDETGGDEEDYACDQDD